MGEGAAPDLGRARHQEGIRRRTDADHEHPRASAHVADHVEQLLLVADRAVGEEHDLAQQVRFARPRIGERRLHRRHHLGAALGLERGHEGLGAREIVGIGRHGVGEQHVHGVVEADHVEAVGRLQPIERVEQARLGLHHRGAAHRAGIVDHEDRFARTLLLRLFERGRRDEGEQVIVVADALAEQPDRRRRLRRRFPGQFEVAVGRHLAVELDDLRVRHRHCRS